MANSTKINKEELAKRFCWEEIEGVYVPFIIRPSRIMYGELSMLKKTLYKKHLEAFNENVFNVICPTVNMGLLYKIMPSEVKLLKDIKACCNWDFFYKNISSSSNFFIKKKDAIKLYEILEAFYQMIVEEKFDDLKFWFINIVNCQTPVPIVDTEEFGVVVPLFFLHCSKLAERALTLTNHWYLSYFELCCKLLSITLPVYNNSLRVIPLDSLETIIPGEIQYNVYRELPPKVSYIDFLKLRNPKIKGKSDVIKKMINEKMKKFAACMFQTIRKSPEKDTSKIPDGDETTTVKRPKFCDNISDICDDTFVEESVTKKFEEVDVKMEIPETDFKTENATTEPKVEGEQSKLTVEEFESIAKAKTTERKVAAEIIEIKDEIDEIEIKNEVETVETNSDDLSEASKFKSQLENDANTFSAIEVPQTIKVQPVPVDIKPKRKYQRKSKDLYISKYQLENENYVPHTNREKPKPRQKYQRKSKIPRRYENQLDIDDYVPHITAEKSISWDIKPKRKFQRKSKVPRKYKNQLENDDYVPHTNEEKPVPLDIKPKRKYKRKSKLSYKSKNEVNDDGCTSSGTLRIKSFAFDTKPKNPRKHREYRGKYKIIRPKLLTSKLGTNTNIPVLDSCKGVGEIGQTSSDVLDSAGKFANFSKQQGSVAQSDLMTPDVTNHNDFSSNESNSNPILPKAPVMIDSNDLSNTTDNILTSPATAPNIQYVSPTVNGVVFVPNTMSKAVTNQGNVVLEQNNYIENQNIPITDKSSSSTFENSKQIIDPASEDTTIKSEPDASPDLDSGNSDNTFIKDEPTESLSENLAITQHGLDESISKSDVIKTELDNLDLMYSDPNITLIDSNNGPRQCKSSSVINLAGGNDLSNSAPENQINPLTIISDENMKILVMLKGRGHEVLYKVNEIPDYETVRSRTSYKIVKLKIQQQHVFRCISKDPINHDDWLISVLEISDKLFPEIPRKTFMNIAMEMKLEVFALNQSQKSVLRQFYAMDNVGDVSDHLYFLYNRFIMIYDKLKLVCQNFF